MLTVVETARAGARVLSFSGKIDARTLSAFEAGIGQARSQGGVRLVLDLAEVSFISSAGFGVLMSVIDDLRDHGGDLKMAAVAADVYRIFELLEFHRVFGFYDTVEQALAAFE